MKFYNAHWRQTAGTHSAELRSPVAISFLYSWPMHESFLQFLKLHTMEDRRFNLCALFSDFIYTYICVCVYVACSESIRRDFFPRKLMKHRRCAVVGRWRISSCAYVDFFPPAHSVSRVQPACEWECIRSARRIVIFCENDGTTRQAVLHQIVPEAWR